MTGIQFITDAKGRKPAAVTILAAFFHDDDACTPGAFNDGKLSHVRDS